ncbi:hypothetical protein EJ110_NYTH21979 [Nymphaea thermarum]|nr:hypothetical protein EJ110_NYTH21979 [Nymphaea thermarum]
MSFRLSLPALPLDGQYRKRKQKKGNALQSALCKRGGRRRIRNTPGVWWCLNLRDTTVTILMLSVLNDVYPICSAQREREREVAYLLSITPAVSNHSTAVRLPRATLQWALFHFLHSCYGYASVNSFWEERSHLSYAKGRKSWAEPEVTLPDPSRGSLSRPSSYPALLSAQLASNAEKSILLFSDTLRQGFCKSPQRDIVSWNTMITGYAQSQQPDTALELLRSMQEQNNVKPMI